MAFDIGEARVELIADLEKLRKDLEIASKEVETILAQTKKDIELNVKINEKTFANIGASLNNVKQHFDDLGKDTAASLRIVDDVVKEASNAIFGYGSVMASAVREGSSALLAMGGSAAALAGPIAIVVGALAVLVVEVIAIAKFIGDVIDRTKEYISQNQELSDAIEKVYEVGQMFLDHWKKTYDFLRDSIAGAIFDYIQSMVETWKEMNRTTAAGDTLLSSLKNLMSQGFQAIVAMMEAVIRVFKSFSGDSQDAKTKVETLTQAVQIMTNILDRLARLAELVAIGFSNVGQNASKAVSLIQPFIHAIQIAISEVQKLINLQLGWLFGGASTPDGDGPYYDPRPTGNSQPSVYTHAGVEVAIGDDEMGPGNLKGKNTWNLANNKNSGSSSSSGSQKQTDPEAEEKKLLNEKLEQYEYEVNLKKELVSLGKATSDDLRKALETLESILSQELLQLQYESNKQETNLQILRTQNEIKNIKEAQVEAEKKSQQEIISLSSGQLKASKDRMQAEISAEEELKNLRIQNSGDFERMKLADIDKHYDKEAKRINDQYKDTTKREELLSQLKIAKQREIESYQIESNVSLMGILQGGYQTVSSVVEEAFTGAFGRIFGEANSLFEMLIENVYRQLLELAASSVFKLILNVFTGGGGGLFGSIVSAVFGTDSGPLVNPDDFAKPKFSLPDLSGFRVDNPASGGKRINLNIDGISVLNQSLSGLDDGQWSKIVDDEMIPQLSRGLKRIGKEILDNSIK